MLTLDNTVFSKLLNNFKEANAKLIFVWYSKMLLKDLENHPRILRKYLLIKMFRPLKKPSRETVPGKY